MTGKEFEAVVLERLRQHEEAGEATACRYGVQGIFTKDQGWRPIQSLPDFEGVLAGGRQFIVEAKVCGEASFPMHDEKFKDRQLRHLKTRARFGVISILLVHFTERVLKDRIVPEQTWAIPVHPDIHLWIDHAAGNAKRLTLQMCEEFGIEVEWTTPAGQRKARPDVFAAINYFAAR